MKTVRWNRKATFAMTASLMALAVVFVLASFRTAQAGDHSFKIKQTEIGPSGWNQYADITVTYSNGTSKQQQVYYSKTGEWKSPLCLASIKGKLVVPPSTSQLMIAPLTGQNICTDAYYEVQWVESQNRYEFVKK